MEDDEDDSSSEGGGLRLGRADGAEGVEAREDVESCIRSTLREG